MELAGLHKKKKCFVSNSALNALISLTQDYKYNETGGSLFGAWDKNGCPVISAVIGPGPKAKHTSVSFFQDIDFAKSERERIRQEKKYAEIGMWHSHHQMDLDDPSNGDIETVENNLKDGDKFVMIICNIKHEKVHAKAFVFQYGKQYEEFDIFNTFDYNK